METKKEMVSIHTEYIQLNQLLKWLDAISTGGQVKVLLDEGAIKINGEVCHEKRKKVYPGDTVYIENVGEYEIVVEP